ncbi:unnamed protein product [Oikopleura dioica]|uniref:Uncharacterized protein n=1 Tax=Oikopleura dioica TaxID=34765 RepID=E4XN20_OIKDI|nr:unnamed protein product [Oikopleura dioica]
MLTFIYGENLEEPPHLAKAVVISILDNLRESTKQAAVREKKHFNYSGGTFQFECYFRCRHFQLCHEKNRISFIHHFKHCYSAICIARNWTCIIAWIEIEAHFRKSHKNICLLRRLFKYHFEGKKLLRPIARRFKKPA